MIERIAFPMACAALLAGVGIATACAADWQVAPVGPRGSVGLTVSAPLGPDLRANHPYRCGENQDDRSTIRLVGATVAALSAGLYLDHRSAGIERFRNDVFAMAGAFAVVGAFNGGSCGRSIPEQVAIGIAASLVSSIADLERGLDYERGIRPLLWSGVQGASLSVFENTLLGRGLASRLGMDLGPGFIQFRTTAAAGDGPRVDYRLRLSSTLGALYFLGQGYDLRWNESLRTGSLVFQSETPLPSLFGEDVQGRAFGNSFVYFVPPYHGPPGRAEEAHRVDYAWSLPAHEKTHTGQIQKGDILAYPVNEWAADQPLLRYLRPGGDLVGLLLGMAESTTAHDDRIVEQGPEGVQAAVLRRGLPAGFAAPR
ncbi:MAG: hypothetical protein KIT73_20910 [Burkholderiales bacterium]|nr:hypothetical protein [Burkholderiales bacterium]